MISRQLLKRITDFYSGSADFNGIPINTLFPNFDQENSQSLIELVEKDYVSINWGYPHPNPHILAFPPLAKETQISWLKTNGVSDHSFCVYPTKKSLKNSAEVIKKYSKRPFTLSLALGDPQFKPLFFEMSVLTDYFDDPRFKVYSNEIEGTISTNNSQLTDKDKIFIQTFGFGIKIDGVFERCVAVYLRYLKHLSPPHQQRWQSKLIRSKKYFLHPQYIKTSNGNWPDQWSIYEAFKSELKIINEMSLVCFGKKLFKKDTFKNDELVKFNYPLRPTSKEFYNFVHLTDKLISENINKKFFDKNFIKHLAIKNASDPGTLLILQEWISINFNPKGDSAYLTEMFDTFKYIRKLRQKPGHVLDSNTWSKKYWSEQRKFIQRAYTALRTLRMIFANHPASQTVNVPDWIFKGMIISY